MTAQLFEMDLECCPVLPMAVARTPASSKTGLYVARYLGGGARLTYTMPTNRRARNEMEGATYAVVTHCPFCGTSLYEAKPSPAKEGV